MFTVAANILYSYRDTRVLPDYYGSGQTLQKDVEIQIKISKPVLFFLLFLSLVTCLVSTQHDDQLSKDKD